MNGAAENKGKLGTEQILKKLNLGFSLFEVIMHPLVILHPQNYFLHYFSNFKALLN